MSVTPDPVGLSKLSTSGTMSTPFTHTTQRSSKTCHSDDRVSEDTLFEEQVSEKIKKKKIRDAQKFG